VFARPPIGQSRVALLLVTVGLLFSGCAGHQKHATRSNRSDAAARAVEIIERVRERFAPDPHMMVFDVAAELSGLKLVLTGELSDTNVLTLILSELDKHKIEARNEIKILPGAELGERAWGIVCLSVASGREAPDHKAELGTQGLMGRKARILKERRRWLLVQTEDRYLSWFEAGAIARCTRSEAEAWENSALMIVTNYESRVLQQPRPGAEPVSDVVMGNLVARMGEEAQFWRVSLPDGRTGFLPSSDAEYYGAWKQSRRPTPKEVERTARLFLGRPYLWGGNSSKAFDCSGFCKLVFLMNGIELNRNASQQALQGREVPLDQNLSALRKGDLLFFGPRGLAGSSGRQTASNRSVTFKPWITHVAIYLGDKKFIQSSERVRISSFDPDAPDFDSFHGRSLLFARRVLTE
jgi:gamma-D-glutamyl-L-lysine dipeptidyl-peptidase